MPPGAALIVPERCSDLGRSATHATSRSVAIPLRGIPEFKFVLDCCALIECPPCFRGEPVPVCAFASLARKSLWPCAGLLILLACSAKLFAAGAQQAPASAVKPAPKFDTSKLAIAPNLSAELAKFKPVKMPYDSARLTPRERQMVAKLVEACQALESIYWRQSDPEGLKLYNELAGSTAPRDRELRRFLRINGSRFNLIENNAPFVGTEPWPPGRSLFPADLTRKEFDALRRGAPRAEDGAVRSLGRGSPQGRRAGSDSLSRGVPRVARSRRQGAARRRGALGRFGVREISPPARRFAARPTTISRATWHGSAWTIRNSTSSSRPMKRISTIFSA